jgi:hypothetical protein
MADSRGYFKVTNSFPEHSKIIEVGGDAGWLHVCALAHCSRNLTDGFVPINLVPRLSDRENPRQLAGNLLAVGLWHAAGHECKKCEQPDDRHYVIHDYLDHQTSAARARETSVKRAIAGQRGGQAKAAASKLLGGGYGDASSKSLAEVEVEVEVHREGAAPPSARKSPAANNSNTGRAAAPAKTKREPKQLTPAPDRLEITEGMAAWASNEHGLSRKVVEFQTARFLDHHRARGNTFKDWTAAWRTWISRVNEYSPNTAQMLQLDDASPQAPKPPYCGQCNERTRMLDDSDLPERCPRCHPSSQKADSR